jgi:DNA repair photolyase
VQLKGKLTIKRQAVMYKHPSQKEVLEKNPIVRDLQVLKNVKIQIKTGIALTISLEEIGNVKK